MLKGGGKRREKFGLKADRREILGGEEKIKEKKRTEIQAKCHQNIAKFKMLRFSFKGGSFAFLFLFFSPFYPKFLDVVVGWGDFPWEPWTSQYKKR